MEGELGSGARIAIALIVVGVIIGIIFVILGFTRGATNQGVSSVQNAMDQMNSSVFDDYDQQILSGTQVSAALKLFEGRPIGMVVVTTLSSKATAPYGLNYGALFHGVDSTATPPYSITVTALQTNRNGASFYTQNLQVGTDGTMKYNMNTIQTKKSGTNEFIRPTAKFLAELIKDTSGTVTGICFTQQ